MKKISLLFLLAVLTAAEPLAVRGQDSLDTISLPEGFSIEVYAEDVPNARMIVLSETGTLFISTRRAGNVYAVRDEDADGYAETKFTIATDLNMPNGVALRNGALYVAEVNRIWRYDDIEAQLDEPPEPILIKGDLPEEGHHGWKFIAFGPDDKLYVPVGAPCNICEREDPYASILRMNPDGSEVEVFARGVRNTVGFTWHPLTNELWFTDNGRDMLGDDIPPCELNHAPVAGMHFGYPYFHGGDIADPEFGVGKSMSDYVAPAQRLGAHVAPLGIEFYQGDQFPDEYRHQIFIAEHGSWNRSEKSGYRLAIVRVGDDGQPVSYEAFAQGWLRDGENWGRPVDLEHMPDGSLLVSDDQRGKVYRISYAE